MLNFINNFRIQKCINTLHRKEQPDATAMQIGCRVSVTGQSRDGNKETMLLTFID